MTRGAHARASAYMNYSNNLTSFTLTQNNTLLTKIINATILNLGQDLFQEDGTNKTN